MKVAGIGTDLVEVARIERFAQTPGALERIFSDAEIEYCLARKNKYEHFAVRFAAKEAVYKALPFDSIAFKNIEVTNLPDGQPLVTVKDERAKALVILISLSHTAQYAAAFALVQQ